jgi:hypothetical protein
MFKSKFISSILIFIFFLIVTSTIKNKTRILEKEILSLNNKILSREKNINEAQLDFYYLSSPQEVEKRLNLIGFDNYQPIAYSKIFFNISDFTIIEKKTSNLNNLNEQKTKKN